MLRKRSDHEVRGVSFWAGRESMMGKDLKGLGHLDRPLKVEGDVAHQLLLGGRKLEGWSFHLA